MAFKLESQFQKRTQSNFRFTRKIYIFPRTIASNVYGVTFIFPNAKNILGEDFKFYSQSNVENRVKELQCNSEKNLAPCVFKAEVFDEKKKSGFDAFPLEGRVIHIRNILNLLKHPFKRI